MAVALVTGACAADNPPAKEYRGRVIDYDTGRGIPGALVVGQFMGSIAWAGGSCDRVESAVSDADGYFTMAQSSRGKPPILHGYARGYRFEFSPRYVVELEFSSELWERWQVWNELRDENRETIRSTLKVEPKVYHSRFEAEEASRMHRDLYLRKSSVSGRQRIAELEIALGSGICGGGPQTTSGPIDYLEAIYREMVDLGASADSLRTARNIIDIAIKDRERSANRMKGGQR